MSSKPHEIFVNEEDRWNWDKYIQRWNQSELGDADQRRTNDALRYLRSTLGDGYLRRADRERNPMLFWYFTNWSDGARLSMIRFAEALRALKGSIGYKAILKRVRRPKNLEELLEGRSVVEVAYRFFRAGFSIEEFEPRVSVPDHHGVDGPKKPDMKVVDRETGEEIIVEVSRMNSSDHQNLISRTYEVIWYVLVHEGMHSDPEALKNILSPRYILPYARIHRGIEEDELKGIVGQLRALVAQVRSSGKFGELIIPETIEVGIASYDDHDRAVGWATSREIREHDLVEGPNLLTDEIGRAKGKLRDKLKQLPDDMPGIVVLTPSIENVILFVSDIVQLAAALEEVAGEHPKLDRVIMFHTFDDGKDESWSINVGPHTFTRLIRSDGAAERSLTVRNQACKHPLAADTLKKLDAAFATG